MSWAVAAAGALWLLAIALYVRDLGWRAAPYVAVIVLMTNLSVAAFGPSRGVSHQRVAWGSAIAAATLLAVTRGHPVRAMDPNSVPGQPEQSEAESRRVLRTQLVLIAVLLLASVPVFLFVK